MACTGEENMVTPDVREAVELTGIEAVVSGATATRAPALDKDHYVGRSAFVSNDVMVLTSIKRTGTPIPGFSYKGIEYKHTVEAGQTAGSWDRVTDKGATEASNQIPERIYWSDAANPHTFIGYSIPQPFDGFTWDETSAGTYQGALRATATTSISTGETYTYIDHSDNDSIITDDLLLTYATDKVAETGGSVAKMYFHHALANVRVIVNISGFSVSETQADTRSVVRDMVLKDMPVKYKWDQQSAGVTALPESDNVKKDTKMWIPRAQGTGSGMGKQFVFYALAVPCTRAANEQKMQFEVKYQDPMHPWKDPSTQQDPNMIAHTYTAVMPHEVKFMAGYCTTIHIGLNHRNEEITVGAEYMDWQYVETPDQSELKKNSTMLSDDMLSRNNFTIAEDPKATADDATWLYIDGTDAGGKPILKDIYGNDGTQQKPFSIETAQQLVSFAHEVKKGRTFEGQYVKLDADIVLQPRLNVDAKEAVEWCGIGDATHVFNGTFLGEGRTIRHLHGSPFFDKLGAQAIVERLNFSDVIEVDGQGIVANESSALIAAVYANGTIRQSAPKEGESTVRYSGSLVGTVKPKGGLISCAHVGDVEAYAKGDGAIGGLVGYNQGLLLSCYHSGKEKNLSKEGYNTYAGVGKYDKDKDKDSYAFSCYYNIDADPDKSDFATLVHGKLCFPVKVEVMQSDIFVEGTGAIEVQKDGSSAPETIHDKHWMNPHYSLNQALEVFFDHVDKNDIPPSIQNASHASWYKQNYKSYFFTYTPGTFPRVQ